MSDLTDKLKGKLRAKRKEPESVGLSTGYTLLNLACTGNPDHGYLTGGYYFYVGDSASGKSWMTWSAFAEACKNPAFRSYRLVLNDAENGSLMDVERFFGKQVKRRVETVISPDLDHYYDHLEDCLKGESPVVYALDSMDALKPRADIDKQAKNKRAAARGKEAAGDYGVAKAKMNSNRMPGINALLRDTGSILIVISQTRDRIGFGAQFDPKTRSGGTALRFYAQLEVWTSVRERLKTKVKGKDVGVGILAKATVKKNRVTGKNRSTLIPIYHSHGVDDTGGMVKYLIDWNHWKKGAGGYVAKEFDVSGGTEEEIVKEIEDGERVGELRSLVARVWGEVEAEAAIKRKPRYE